MDWHAVWLVWIGLVAGSFAVIEGIAVRRKASGDTLSEFLRFLIGLSRGVRTVALVTFIGVALWLVDHLWFGGS